MTTPIKRPGKWKRRLIRSLLGMALVLGALSGWLYWQLRASLPQLDGELVVAGVIAPVTIERDSGGIPTIQAASRTDAAYALGLLHGQDRFFQMDLMRRVPSGRLSELIGGALIENDKAIRKQRFHPMARQVVDRLPPDQRDLLDSYTAGVNRGLESLAASPPEYLLLRQSPQLWEPSDSLLVIMAMICDLEPYDARFKLAWAELRSHVPDEVFDFLVRKGSTWDAPLDDSEFTQPAIPSASIWSLRALPDVPRQVRSPTNYPVIDQTSSHLASVFPNATPVDWETKKGSNHWAVAGHLAPEGRALLASDMHLGLSVPAIWYRAVMSTPDSQGNPQRLVGVTLPGVPLVVAGSNGSIAWGLTAKHGEFGDLIELQPAGDQPNSYLTPAGPQQLSSYTEQIAVAGGSSVEVQYDWSIWGPVVANRDGRRLVHRWIGNDVRAYDLAMLDMESIATAEEALKLANAAGAPRLNFLVADRQGNIGWTILGRLPHRTQPAAMKAADWSREAPDWHELLPADQYPRVVNTTDGRIWTANNRVLGEDYLRIAGYGEYDIGGRARQIRDRLRSETNFDEKKFLAIQLDDRALFLQRWRDLLLQVADRSSSSLTAECREYVENWGDRAAVDSVGYRVVYQFRRQVIDAVFGMSVFYGSRAGTTAPAGSLNSQLAFSGPIPMSYEDVSWQLIAERPEHWLPKAYTSWDDLLAAAARATEEELRRERPLAEATWGERNTIRIQHPLSLAVPQLARWLDMPVRQLPGDDHMPRVQAPRMGASQRMVVAPGREEAGFYHQPGGASGHFLSPYFQSGFDDWADGTASPLLPGPTQHTLTLKPTRLNE